MSVIYVLLAISISVALLFFGIFWLAVRSGQFDDPYTPSVRMLFEDEVIDPPAEIPTSQTSNTTTNKQ